ncbi:hypothetical protein FV222_07690 [Methylobacterium sp. WL103]|nr:hypothetical protein FV222_07690 [Methylobacterium sp. WL103]
MDTARRLPWERNSKFDVSSVELTPDEQLANVVRLLPPLNDIEGGSPLTRRSSAQNWSKLIDRVRDAANHARDVEVQAREQELRINALFDRLREDVRCAGERVQESEARSVEIQIRADVLLRAADERIKKAEEQVKAADERARTAENWLSRLYDTIEAEFEIKPSLQKTG